MSSTAVEPYESYGDTQSKQKLNRMYSDMRGATQKVKIIKILTVIAVIFGTASIISSSFGFYYDFVQMLGTNTIYVAVILGITIEAMKLVSMWGAFAWEDNIYITYAFWVSLAVFIVFALVLHFRGLANYETVAVKDTISQVRNDALALQQQRENRADRLADLNIRSTNRVLNNGTAYDDKFVIKNMSQNNKTIQALRQDGVLSEIDLMYINQQKKSAESMKNSLGVVFPIIELLAVLGIFILFLKKYSTSEGVRSLVETKEKIAELEANYATMAENALIQGMFANMAQNGFNQQPQAQQQYQQPQPTQVGGEPECGFSLPEPPKEENQIVNDFLEIEYKETPKEEEIEVQATNVKVRALDLTNLPDGFKLVAQTMFDNGEVEVGEQLIPQSTVKKRLTKQGVRKVQSLVDLTYDHLRNYGYIAKEGTNGSHVAKAQLPKTFWTEASA